VLAEVAGAGVFRPLKRRVRTAKPKTTGRSSRIRSRQLGVEAVRLRARSSRQVATERPLAASSVTW
jgi:hypothetical protein